MLGSLDPAIGFVTVPLWGGGGFAWTLPARMGSFLAELEAAYGSRDQSYTPLGIEFCGDRPGVWYPGNRKHVAIMLEAAARLIPAKAIFQLAHETVHLLSPTGGRHAPEVAPLV